MIIAAAKGFYVGWRCPLNDLSPINANRLTHKRVRVKLVFVRGTLIYDRDRQRRVKLLALCIVGVDSWKMKFTGPEFLDPTKLGSINSLSSLSRRLQQWSKHAKQEDATSMRDQAETSFFRVVLKMNCETETSNEFCLRIE